MHFGAVASRRGAGTRSKHSLGSRPREGRAALCFLPNCVLQSCVLMSRFGL